MRLQETPPYLGRGRMKKFFQKQAADWRFRKAGAGHRLDEEKPKIQPKKSQPGRSLEISPNLLKIIK